MLFENIGKHEYHNSIIIIWENRGIGKNANLLCTCEIGNVAHLLSNKDEESAL